MTVAELLDTVLPKLASRPQESTFLGAVQTVQEVITRRLWMVKSELLEGDFSLAVAAGGNSAALDADTLGLKLHLHPWIVYDGQRFELRPLPAGLKDSASLEAESRPEYYRLRGNDISLYPTTDADLTLKGEAYLKPAAITALSDVLPWFGFFDQVFIDAVAKFGAGGLMLTVTSEMTLFLYQQVDQVAFQRPARRIAWHYPA